MPRKVIINASEIYEARGDHWTEHLQKYNQAKLYSPDTPQRVLDACTLLPFPTLNIFGALDDWNYSAARAVPRWKFEKAVRLAQIPIELLVKWYWSETHWKELGRLWGELPQPAPRYEWSWNDGYITLVPMSIAIPSQKRNHKRNPAMIIPNIHTEIVE